MIIINVMFVILFMVKLVLSVVVTVKATAEAVVFDVLPFVMEKIRKVKVWQTKEITLLLLLN